MSAIHKGSSLTNQRVINGEIFKIKLLSNAMPIVRLYINMTKRLSRGRGLGLRSVDNCLLEKLDMRRVEGINL